MQIMAHVPRTLVFVICPNTRNHEEEPGGVLVSHIFVTYYDTQQEVWTDPPNEVWRFCFESTVAKVVFSPCRHCK